MCPGDDFCIADLVFGGEVGDGLLELFILGQEFVYGEGSIIEAASYVY